MEKAARFSASLELSQYVSDMTPSALVLLMFGIQIILVARERTVGLVEKKVLVISGFWLQGRNHHTYAFAMSFLSR
jgi:hypothetical protein